MRPRTVREGRRELSQEDTTDKTEEGVRFYRKITGDFTLKSLAEMEADGKGL